MRDGRGTLGTCLAKVKRSQGSDLDKLSRGLKKITQKGSPDPADVPSWKDQPAVCTDRRSQDAAASLEIKGDLSQAELHSGHKALPNPVESMGRDSALAAPSKALGLSSAPARECLAGVSRGIGEALGKGRPGRGSGATDSHGGQCPKGESWVWGWPGQPEPWEMGLLEGEPLSAFSNEPGAESELSCPCSELFQMPDARHEFLPKDKTRFVCLDDLKTLLSVQTVGYEKTLGSIQSTFYGLQMILGSLAQWPSRSTNLLRHS